MALEGWIEEYFMPEYFRVLCSEFSIEFERDLQIGNPLPNKPMGKNANLKRLPLISQDFLSNTQNEQKERDQNYLLLFGVDLEWEEAGKRIETEIEIEGEIARITHLFTLATGRVNQNLKVLFIPIRCFDSWVGYLENEFEPIGHLETISNEAIKNKVYGSKKSSQIKSDTVVKRLEKNGLLNSNQFNRLSTQSPSFKHFHDQILTYLQKIS